MIIIIDGIDKTGKTTFINTLMKKTPCIMLKNQHKPNTEDDAKLKQSYYAIYKFLKKNHKKYTIILDRYYMSQLVYSVLRGKDSFNDDWYTKLENKLCKLDHLYVQCVINPELLLKRHITEPDDYLKIEKLNTIYNRYDLFFHITKLDKVQLNIEPNFGFDIAIEALLEEINNG